MQAKLAVATLSAVLLPKFELILVYNINNIFLCKEMQDLCIQSYFDGSTTKLG